MSLQQGDAAPAFVLEVPDGTSIRLDDYRGRKLVLYFYPKDDTTGCTREAIDFSALKTAFDKTGAVILGVSKDSVASHAKFKTKHDLSIDLGSDVEGKVIEAYGVSVEKNMYGRKYMGIERATFLIDRTGKIADIWRKVKVADHARHVLVAAESLD